MAIQNPTIDELRAIAKQNHFTQMTESEFRDMSAIINKTLDSHRFLDAMDDCAPTDISDRDRGYPAAEESNPYRAWVWRCEISGLTSGPLNGMRVAIKDNVAIAGLPMKIGCNLLNGFVADEDATIVTRVLQAGGTITGKAACEHLSFSGSSFTADTGAILNPHDITRSAGGSSSGSAALIAAGEVDVANGGDQAGSIRIPAAFCGVYGLKPSYGLVPATGVNPIEYTVDHVGPLATSVKGIAAFLDAVAGYDLLDPRTHSSPAKGAGPSFASSLTGDIRGLRIGIVAEGFDWDNSEADVDSAVEQAAKVFNELGACVEWMSLPCHRDGVHINTGIQMEGAFDMMLRTGGGGRHWRGRYPRRLMEVLGKALHEQPDNLSDMMKELSLLGTYLTDKYQGAYYAKAQNLALEHTRAHNEIFQQYDLLLMPSTPMKATKIPDPSVDRVERFGYLLDMIGNTSPACVSGHPSISIPCAISQGLPVGLMLTGRRLDEATVLRAAHAFEQTGIYGDVRVDHRERQAADAKAVSHGRAL